MTKLDIFNIKERVISDGFFTDKENFYLTNYEEFFKDLRHEEINFLEIGIDNGGSLLMWAEYFKNASVYGIDMKENLPQVFYDYLNKKSYRSKVTTVLGFETPDLSVPLTKRKKIFKEKLGNISFDIILDDGAHTYTHTKGSFDVLFHDYLKPGGLYIIEDWGTTYFPRWPDGSPSGEQGMARLIRELYDDVALLDRLKGQNRRIDNVKAEIYSITIRLGQIWVQKNY